MKTIDQIAQFFNDSEYFNGGVKLNENLATHTTMHVGGNAKLFLEPENEESLVFAIKELKKLDADERRCTRIKSFFVLGGGSNVIISDDGLDAVISTRKMNGIDADERGLTQIKVDSGSSWGSVISFCKKENLGGFEGFTGLSGTVGGALYMNATCFALSACDNLISAEYFDSRDGKIHVYEKKESDWGYKKSPFQSADFRRFPQIILSAKFALKPGFDSQKSEQCMASRKEKGHFRAPSSGSAFKNDAAHGIIAGKVIDECGLKGFSVGGAQIAPWHGNFIINPEQKATASDIKNLSDQVKRIVYEKKGIILENEILFI